jgi:transposase
MHYLVKDTEFQAILKFLVQVKGLHKNDTDRLRRFIEAVYYICRTGCQWRLLPTYYGDWRSVHKRFKRWSERNIWQSLFEFSQVDPDMELVMIDATIIRAHACAAGYAKNTQKGEALGRSKGGFTTKIHAMVDALGNPIKFTLTPGQRHDIIQAKTLTETIKGIPLIADKAYDCDEFIMYLQKKECTPIIPPKRNRISKRTYDKYIYRERHLIECFFGKVKHFRRIFSRYDKLANSYLSFLYFAGALIWFR